MQRTASLTHSLLVFALFALLTGISAPADSEAASPAYEAPAGRSQPVTVSPERRDADGNRVVAVVTPLGSFRIELLAEQAPATVANFLQYVTDGDYVDSFIHRSVPGFVVQGGGFVFTSDGVVDVPTDPPVVNEFGLSNLRGTVAMAKLGGDPDSATSGWFVNLADNSANLDEQNGGFTVFGRVLGDGMSVVDAIAAAPIFNAGAPFDELPLIDYTAPDPVLKENVITTTLTLGSARDVRPPILLRRTTNRRWFSYRLSFDNTTVTVEEEGSVGLSRNRAYATVSRGDFDGDGEADVMLRGTRGGKKGRWLAAMLSGTEITSKGSVGITRDTDFEIAATADFDGNGKDDLLLRNVTDGRWMLYLLDGKTITASGLLELSTDLADEFVGTGDFNGDGRADVLLRRANGSWLLYTLDGLTAPTIDTPKLTKGRKWELQSIADFNGDGCADVLLRHRKKGRWQMFVLRGARVIQKKAPKLSRDRDFSLRSDADFTGDGTADALLRSTDGSWLLYSLSGPKILTGGSLDMTADVAFEIALIADFNADGKADALLRHTDGRWLLYGLDGTVPTVLGSATPPLDDSSTWVLQVD